jgi:hypothetical protein
VAQLWDYNKTNTYDHDLQKHIEVKRKIAKFKHISKNGGKE